MSHPLSLSLLCLVLAPLICSDVRFNNREACELRGTRKAACKETRCPTERPLPRDHGGCPLSATFLLPTPGAQLFPTPPRKTPDAQTYPGASLGMRGQSKAPREGTKWKSLLQTMFVSLKLNDGSVKKHEESLLLVKFHCFKTILANPNILSFSPLTCSGCPPKASGAHRQVREMVPDRA